MLCCLFHFMITRTSNPQIIFYSRIPELFKMKISQTLSRLALETFSRKAVSSSRVAIRHFPSSVALSDARVAIRCLSSSSVVLNDKHVVRSKIADVAIPDLNVFDYIWRDAVSKHGDKVAMVNNVK